MEKVWIVTTWESDTEPMVNPFNNKEAAEAYYHYERFEKYHNCCIDECEVFSKFYDGSSWITFENEANRCCSTCKNMRKLFEQEKGKYKIAIQDGFVCLKEENIAMHLIGLNPDEELCEKWIPKNTM